MAAFTKSLDGTGTVLTVDGSGSADPDGGAIAGYAWDFGDGTTATGAKPPAHTYVPGRYDVTLTVTDDEGKTDSLTQLVRVMGPPSGTWRISRVLGRVVNADAGLMVDPDGGAIAPTRGTGVTALRRRPGRCPVPSTPTPRTAPTR